MGGVIRRTPIHLGNVILKTGTTKKKDLEALHFLNRKAVSPHPCRGKKSQLHMGGRGKVVKVSYQARPDRRSTNQTSTGTAQQESIKFRACEKGSIHRGKGPGRERNLLMNDDAHE